MKYFTGHIQFVNMKFAYYTLNLTILLNKTFKFNFCQGVSRIFWKNCDMFNTHRYINSHCIHYYLFISNPPAADGPAAVAQLSVRCRQEDVGGAHRCSGGQRAAESDHRPEQSGLL